jgi:hypothetical protein
MAQKGKQAKSRTKKTAAKAVKKTQVKPAVASKPKVVKIPNSFQLTAQALNIIKTYWRPLFGIVIVYGILNIIFASGLSGLDAAVNDIKANLNNSTDGVHPLARGLSGFGSLVGSAGASGSSSASILQSLVFIVESLVIIWALRQLLAGKIVRIKMAYYSSMYPFVPFVLVMLFIILQLLPISLGSLVLSTVLTSAVSNITLATWIGWLVFIPLAAWSFYMISSSIFAIYIVSLPDTEPRAALRSAKKLVRGRRWEVIPKILFLPLFVLVVMGIIVIPLIVWAAFLVAPVFYALSMLTVLFVHTYLYCLYRRLIA